MATGNPPGRPKGTPKTGGRTKGTPNKATAEAKSLCQRLVTDRAYRASFRMRFKAGELPPPLEAMVWHYAYGKPTEHVQVDGDGEGGPLVVRFVDV